VDVVSVCLEHVCKRRAAKILEAEALRFPHSVRHMQPLRVQIGTNVSGHVFDAGLVARKQVYIRKFLLPANSIKVFSDFPRA
jgi:hypothetical protein